MDNKIHILKTRNGPIEFRWVGVEPKIRLEIVSIPTQQKKEAAPRLAHA